MKGLLFVFVFIGFLLVIFKVFGGRAGASGSDFSARVVRVYDGDTIGVVTPAGGSYRVRLAGIDAPEVFYDRVLFFFRRIRRQPFAREARLFLERSLLGRYVRVEAYGVGPYRRLLAFVFLDGRNLNVELVERGLAEVYHGGTFGPYRGVLYEAERRAKKGMKGIWSLGDGYESPRTFRKEMGR